MIGGFVMAITVVVGCYTDEEHPKGLNLLSVEPKDGTLALVDSYAIENPLYLAIAPDGKTLYTNERDGLGSFAIAPDGTLKRRDFLACGGRAMCYLSLSADGRRVNWAAYSNALAGSVEVKDGEFGRGETHTFVGKGPNRLRQGEAHFHCAVPEPDGHGYAVCDLGTDHIFSYRDDGSRRDLVTEPAGAGPRHVLFHPNGRLAFVVFELRNLIASYEWSEEQGFGKQLDRRETLPVWPTGRAENGDLAAAIRFSPDGKCVIVSNRGEQSLVAFAFDEKTGRLEFKARTILPGNWPRDFIFLDETHALAAMERSGEIHCLEYDPASGEFKVLATLGGFFRPIALIFPKKTCAVF